MLEISPLRETVYVILVVLCAFKAASGAGSVEIHSPHNNSQFAVQCPCIVSIFLPSDTANVNIYVANRPHQKHHSGPTSFSYILHPVIVNDGFQNYTWIRTVKYRFKNFQSEHLFLSFLFGSNFERTNEIPQVSLNYNGGGSVCPILFPEHPPISVNSLDKTPENNLGGTARIVGGSPSNYDIAAYLVLFSTPTKNGPARTCTGTLVSSGLAVSAAHCKLSNLTNAIIGTEDPSSVQWKQAFVKEFIPHPKFNMSDGVSSSARYDIAYVRLYGHIPDHVRFMKLNIRREVTKSSFNARTVGYGILRSQMIYSNPSLTLHQVDLPIVSGPRCVEIYNRLSVDIDDTLQICAGYENHECGAW